jgi:hypothetical protein
MHLDRCMSFTRLGLARILFVAVGLALGLTAAAPPSSPSAKPKIVSTGKEQPDMVSQGEEHEDMVTRGRRIQRLTWDPVRHPDIVRFDPDPDAPAPSGLLYVDLDGKLFLPLPVGLESPTFIDFQPNDAGLTDETEARLEGIATTLKEHVEVQVLIRAVETSGAPSDLRTAQLRVEAIATLLKEVGIDAERISTEVLEALPEDDRSLEVLELRAV